MKTLLKLLAVCAILYGFLLSLVGCASIQRKLLYFPSHLELNNEMAPWFDQHELIGYSREAPEPQNIWLMLHGNGGQASHRASTLSHFSRKDSVFILEYPGYGWRSGTPSSESINAAALRALRLLQHRFPTTSVCVVGESLGSGPACFLAAQTAPPEKIVLIVPYDELCCVASEHYPFLPVRLIMHDNWNNIDTLKNYIGPIDIFAGSFDEVIPARHAQHLAASKPQAHLTLFTGGHNDWPGDTQVRIENP